MVRLGVVGLGHWGPNLVRNFAAVGDEACVTWLCDTHASHVERAKALAPQARGTTRASELFAADDCDAVAIMTPSSTHHALALAAIRAGKHVLVGKPMARSLVEARALDDAARATGRVLCVDHTLVFDASVRDARAKILAGAIGAPRSFTSERCNVGRVQRDSDVLWDLVPHDLAVLDAWGAGSASVVAAVGEARADVDRATDVHVTIRYESGLVARIHASWLAATKLRRMTIAGERGSIVVDDAQPTPIEPLLVEARHFVACCAGREAPVAGAREGMRVVEILEAASRSMSRGGVDVTLGARA